MACRRGVLTAVLPLLLASHFWLVRGWRRSGLMLATSGTELYYVGKFYYDRHRDTTEQGSGGRLSISIHGSTRGEGRPIDSDKHATPVPGLPVGRDGMYLAIFVDDNRTKSDDWTAIRQQWNDLDCVDFLSRSTKFFPVLPLESKGVYDMKVTITDTSRPRLFYFSFVFCEFQERDTIDFFTYSIHARNENMGFQAEFSMEETGLVWIHLSGAFLFGIIFVAAIAYALRKYGLGALRSRLPLQFVLISCLLSCMGCGCKAFHELVYAADGVGAGGFEIFGELSSCLARVLLSLLQLFIARGKSLLNADEGRFRRLFLQALVVAIVFLNLGCEVYGRLYANLDWSTTMYFYESWPGFMILALNTVLFVEVCIATIELFRRPEHDVQVRRLYKGTFAVAVGYFIALPITCLIAYLLSPWNRKRTITRVEVTVRFIATVILIVWFKPSRLDCKVNARLETSENRDAAVELADPLGPPTTTSMAQASFPGGVGDVHRPR